jgi:hypothetical protein
MTEEGDRVTQVERWASHCSTKHNAGRNDGEITKAIIDHVTSKLNEGESKTTLKMKFEELRRAIKDATHTNPCEAVEGMRIYAQALACGVPECCRVRLSVKSFRNHIREDHKEIETEKWEMWTRRVHAQTWGGTNQTKGAFPVETGGEGLGTDRLNPYADNLIRELDDFLPKGIVSEQEMCDTRVLARDKDDLEFFTNFERVVDLATATKHSGWVNGDEGGGGIQRIEKDG